MEEFYSPSRGEAKQTENAKSFFVVAPPSILFAVYPALFLFQRASFVLRRCVGS
jgi:hypothetical protein